MFQDSVWQNTAKTVRLLVVSRESTFLLPLCSIAESNAWHVESATSAWDAMERIQSGLTPHMFVLDLPRGDGDSLHILRWLRRFHPDLPVIVTCSPEDAGYRKEAIRLGAQEVLTRPFEESRLESSIYRHLIGPENGGGEIASEDIEQLGPDSFFISASPITQKLRAQTQLLAEADVPVLILGEAGSGKDTVARLIHKRSVRSGFSFVKVNCAGMPGELLETELFGSERTSSSGSGQAGTGKLQRAERGSLFVNEITEMPLGLQTKLMHVLHDKVLYVPGCDKALPIDVRVLAATSMSIDRALAEKKLREDLYYRLSAFTVQVPPLRQRKSEVALLLRHSMHQLAKHYGLPPREFPLGVLDACQRYSWPGNLKELENFVKRYLVAGDTELPFNNHDSSVRGNGRSYPVDATAGMTLGGGNAEEDQSGPKSLKSLIQTLKCEAERNAIGTALQKTGWNRKAAARLLQVSYRTLLYKIEQYHMNSSESLRDVLPEAQFPLVGAGSKSKAS